MNNLASRRKTYYKLSSRIARLDNGQLQALLGTSESSTGWGKNQTIEPGGSKIFVKRLPVTDLEYENLFSTRNLYDLPTYYNYGVGSAGLGVFRELAAHLKSTQWVLDGAIETFPLMYHYRFIPFSGARQAPDVDDSRRYIEHWGGSENVGKYMLDRVNANHELILFLEYVPHVLTNWLAENSAETERILEQLRATIAFMRKNGMIHFDAHYWNIVTDGERPYLTDFGLVLDRGFALSKTEELFFQRNAYYDYGEALVCLGDIAASLYRRLPEDEKRRAAEKYGIAEDAGHWDSTAVLLDNIEQVQADGILKLAEPYSRSVVKYRKIIALVSEFFSTLSRNPKKDTPFPDIKLQRLLKQAGVI